MSSEWPLPRSVDEMYDLAPVGSNRPTAGARFDAELPIGEAPLQLYSVATPNGENINTKNLSQHY
jgi:GSH-dependent disulfide-bond oxidoreductase